MSSVGFHLKNGQQGSVEVIITRARVRVLVYNDPIVEYIYPANKVRLLVDGGDLSNHKLRINALRRFFLIAHTGHVLNNHGGWGNQYWSIGKDERYGHKRLGKGMWLTASMKLRQLCENATPAGEPEEIPF